MKRKGRKENQRGGERDGFKYAGDRWIHASDTAVIVYFAPASTRLGRNTSRRCGRTSATTMALALLLCSRQENRCEVFICQA